MIIRHKDSISLSIKGVFYYLGQDKVQLTLGYDEGCNRYSGIRTTPSGQKRTMVFSSIKEGDKLLSMVSLVEYNASGRMCEIIDLRALGLVAPMC